MTHFRDMGARQLRQLAPEIGLTGASRMKQADIIAWIEEHVTKLTPAQRQFLGVERMAGKLTRSERDALRRTPIALYHPAEALPEKVKGRAGLNREQRRHFRWRNGPEHARSRVVNVPRRYRERGLMVPVTADDLMYARIDAEIAR
jgi:hypothetical protein